jgi:hypothetical protein
VDPFPQQPGVESLWETIVGILITVAAWAGPPLFIVAAVVSTIRGLKRRRRNRRRKRLTPANRYAGAWQELVDSVRDLAEVDTQLRTDEVTFGATRREHAVAFDATGILPAGAFTRLATRVDEIVYGVADPTAKDARTFWAEIDATRRQLIAGLSRRQRWRVALSVRSLRAADPTRSTRRSVAPNLPNPTTAFAGGRTP